ncbi:MAG: DUF1844 domain-containing protein [bacterium]
MDTEFFTIVLMMQSSVMINLGKVSNPATGKAERNLPQAKAAIDILEMLKRKTKGNLDKEEEKLLGNMLAEAQLNYVSEQKKEETEKKDKPEEKPASEKKEEPAEEKKENPGQADQKPSDKK